MGKRLRIGVLGAGHLGRIHVQQALEVPSLEVVGVHDPHPEKRDAVAREFGIPALSDPDVDQIVVLSDGAPSAGSWFTKTDLLREVMRLQRWTRARVDVVRIGQDGVAARWRNLLDQLATATGGVSIAR